METTPSSSPPAHTLAFLLWFVTLVLGGVLLALYLLLAGSEDYRAALYIALICSCFAGLFSLPVLLILPVGLRWVFTIAPVLHRWVRLLAVVSGLFGVATFCGYLFLVNNSGEVIDLSMMWFTVPYLPAALLAAAGIYRPWLFALAPQKAGTMREE